MEKKTIELKFESGNLGLRLDGNIVEHVIPGSKCAEQNVKHGWIITHVNGVEQPNDSHEISEAWNKTNSNGKETTITFCLDNCLTKTTTTSTTTTSTSTNFESKNETLKLIQKKKQKYLDLFDNHEIEEDKISGVAVKPTLDASGLPFETLKQIWELSDQDQDGSLTLDEFMIAMFFIDAMKEERMSEGLPTKCPKELIDAIQAVNGSQISAQEDDPEPTSSPWAISPMSWTKWKDIYDTLPKEGNKVSGQQARTVLDKSGLSIEVLTKIWGLSDMDQDGLLTLAEFTVAMFLIDLVKNGKDLPQELPPELCDEVFRNTNITINDGKPLKDWSNEELQNWISTLSDADAEKIRPIFANLLGEDFSTLGKYDVFEELQIAGLSRRKSRQIYRQLIDFNDVDIPSDKEFQFSIKGSKIKGTVIAKVEDQDFPYTVKVADKMHQMKLKVGSMRLIDEYHNDVPFKFLPIVDPNEGKDPLEDWTKDKIADWYTKHKYSTEMKEKFSGMDGKEVATVVEDKEEFITYFTKTKGLGRLVALSIYWEIHELKRFVAPPYEDNYFPGVSLKTVQHVIENNTEESYMQALQSIGKLERIIQDAGDGPIDNTTWNKMQGVIIEAMKDQLKASSKFDFNYVVHRFPDIYPFEFNAMPMFLGSWMGDCFGMMQWPMPGDPYMQVLRQIITNNNIGMIMALGVQNPGERMKMISYWEELGKGKPEDKTQGKTIFRHVKGIPPKNKECVCYHFKEWPDYGSPLDDTSDFDYLFGKVQETEEANQKILIHCRAGVGRSGTFRLMYKAWKGEFGSENLINEVNKQRALRMWTVQTKAQYCFLQKYVRKIEQRTKKASSSSTTTTTTTTKNLEPS